MWGLWRVQGPIACFSAIWVLLANLGWAQYHPTSLRQPGTTTSRTPAEDASGSKDEHQQQVATSSPREQESPQLEIVTGEETTPAAGRGAAAGATIPSPRYANREEWQGVCRLWSGKPHNRYLVFNRMLPAEGIGASLTRVSWALDRSISSDLELVMNGPLLASHHTGDFGDWMGLTHNPLLNIQDPAGFKQASHQRVPFSEGNDDVWYTKQENRTSVVYIPKTMKVDKMLNYGKPVSPANADEGVCRYARQALSNLYWSVPQYRGRCHGLLPDDHYRSPEVDVSEATGDEREGRRPWVVAVHVRRGDAINNEARSLPQVYFSAAVKSILVGIALVDPVARVSVLVFSEGDDEMTGQQLPDMHGNAITWDVQQESCLDTGLACSQKIHLNTSAFDTFDCLAAADIVVASASTFSEGAAAVSTNVKVMLRVDQIEQDRVNLNSTATAAAGVVTPNEQLEMNSVIADWWHCSGESWLSTGIDARSLAARQYYQTVDEVSPPLSCCDCVARIGYQITTSTFGGSSI